MGNGHPLGPARLWLLSLWALLIGTVAISVDPVTRLWVILNPFLATVCFIFLFALITIPSGSLGGTRAWLRFWLIYLTSIPILTLLWLCSLAALSPIALVIGCLIGLPLALTFFFTDGLAVCRHLAALNSRRQRQQFRSGGPSADLPELAWEHSIRWTRVGLAIVFIVIAASADVWWEGIVWLPALFCIAAAVGILRLEAWLLALGPWPLVTYDADNHHWHAGYAARNVLWLPATSIRHTLAINARRFGTSRCPARHPQRRLRCAKPLSLPINPFVPTTSSIALCA